LVGRGPWGGLPLFDFKNFKKNLSSTFSSEDVVRRAGQPAAVAGGLGIGAKLPEAFAVYLGSISIETNDLKNLAEELSKRLVGFSSRITVFFILKPNVGKALGYWLEKQGLGCRVGILDEISVEETSLLQTVDIGCEGLDGRLPVIIKVVRLF